MSAALGIGFGSSRSLLRKILFRRSLRRRFHLVRPCDRLGRGSTQRLRVGLAVAIGNAFYQSSSRRENRSSAGWGSRVRGCAEAATARRAAMPAFEASRPGARRGGAGSGYRGRAPGAGAVFCLGRAELLPRRNGAQSVARFAGCWVTIIAAGRRRRGPAYPRVPFASSSVPRRPSDYALCSAYPRRISRTGLWRAKPAVQWRFRGGALSDELWLGSYQSDRIAFRRLPYLSSRSQ